MAIRESAMSRHLLGAAALLLLLGSCKAPPPQSDAVAAAATADPKLFDSFGDLHRDIGSKVPAAQQYFDQGLRMVYGFNHEAAGRAFAEAARLDPTCAACVCCRAVRSLKKSPPRSVSSSTCCMGCTRFRTSTPGCT